MGALAGDFYRAFHGLAMWAAELFLRRRDTAAGGITAFLHVAHAILLVRTSGLRLSAQTVGCDQRQKGDPAGLGRTRLVATLCVGRQVV